MRHIAAVRGLDATSNAFLRKLIALADREALSADFLAAVMSFETGATFDPQIRNPRSGFVGLIQFGPAAAAAAGTTQDELAKMSAVAQLDYVIAHYRNAERLSGVHPVTVDDHYLAVFAPAFMGKEPSAEFAFEGSKAYDQNRELDSDRDGVITVAEIAAPVRAIVRRAEAREPIAVNMTSPAVRAAALGSIVLVAGLAAYRWG